MGSTPVLATKLFVPARRPQLVSRSRVAERLDTALDPGHRLTLVSAPAGFGKTTLLAEWINGVDPDRARVGWLSLDEGDNDLTRFVTHLVAALRNTGLDVDAAVLESASTADALTPLVNDIARAGDDAWAARSVVVLDDYHVIAAAEVHEAVTFLLDHLPDHLRLVIATRSDPPLPLTRLRSRGQLTELRAAELRFTPDEAREFLNRVMGLELTTADVDALEDRTEGWIAGLQLAALSLRGIADPAEVADFIRAFAGSHRFVIDYLADEVLARQPPPVRDFLLRTAVLERLTGPLCDAVTGGTDGTRTLVDLERGNLFVVPLDIERSWYRYHHLFADVLHARLLAEHPDELASLHGRASDWFAARGQAADAVRHALAAGNVDRAAYLMEEALPGLRRARQDSLLHHWMRSLPEPAIRRSPVLSIVSGWSHLMAGDLDAAASRLDDAEAALVAGAQNPDLASTWADTEDLRTAPATIAVYRASLAQARGDVADTVRQARSALDRAASSGWPPGRPGTSTRHCPHSPMPCAACTPPATTSTSWTPRWCWPTCGSPRVDRAAPAGCTSRPCGPRSPAVNRIPGPRPTCTSAWPTSTGNGTTSRARKRISKRPASWANGPPSPRTGTGGTSSRPNSGRSAATTTPRWACSTRRRRSTGTASTPTCVPSPR
jgi:LuxR family maltose regulon positive regulatory protein